MPILAAEPGIYPSELFGQRSCVTGSDRTWWVLHTRPRQEKSLARQLRECRVPFFLPMVTRRSLFRGRPRSSYLPLFSSYLFLLSDAAERIVALSTKRVVRSIEVNDQERLWYDLGQIHRLIESGAPITPEDRLQPGMEVEIRSGSLAGLRGTIVRTASGRRLIVKVDFVQRGASVELDDFMLIKAT